MGFGKGKNERFVCTTAPLFFRRSHAGETLLFVLAILDSAPSGFRPLMFFFASNPFFWGGERYVLPPPTETLRFLERAQRSPASAGKPLFFSGERNVFSSPWSSFLFRGRRQLPQAGEVRRPRRARGVVEVDGWLAGL